MRLPAFCVGEAYGALLGRSKKRTQLHLNLTQELKELARSTPYTDAREQFQDLTRLLSDIGQEERRRLDSTIMRVLDASNLIPIDHETVQTAMALQESRDLEPADSLVYSSVLSDLSRQQKILGSYFITKNSKDFANPDIVSDLARLDCNLSQVLEKRTACLSNAGNCRDGPFQERRFNRATTSDRLLSSWRLKMLLTTLISLATFVAGVVVACLFLRARTVGLKERLLARDSELNHARAANEVLNADVRQMRQELQDACALQASAEAVSSALRLEVDALKQDQVRAQARADEDDIPISRIGS